MINLESRARERRGVRPIARHLGVIVQGERVYCVSCGSADGFVPVDLPPGVIYVCGECEGKYGVPPEMTPRPDLDAIRAT